VYYRLSLYSRGGGKGSATAPPDYTGKDNPYQEDDMADWQDFWQNTTMEQNRINFLGRKLEAMERKLDLLLKELKIDIPEEPESPHLAEVKAFINQGNKIEAIRVYREKFHATLAEAKSAIEDLERGLRK